MVRCDDAAGTLGGRGHGTVTNVHTGKSVTGGYVNSYHPATGKETAATYNANTGQVKRARYNTRSGQATENSYNINNRPAPTNDKVYADRNGQVYRQNPSGGRQ